MKDVWYEDDPNRLVLLQYDDTYANYQVHIITHNLGEAQVFWKIGRLEKSSAGGFWYRLTGAEPGWKPVAVKKRREAVEVLVKAWLVANGYEEECT